MDLNFCFSGQQAYHSFYFGKYSKMYSHMTFSLDPSISSSLCSSDETSVYVEDMIV